jgi:hypothetical protein
MGQSTALATQRCLVEGKKEGLYLHEAFSHLILLEARVRRVVTKQLLSERMVLQLLLLLPAVRPTMGASSDRLSAAPLVQVYLPPVCLPATAESWPCYLLAQFPAA